MKCPFRTITTKEQLATKQVEIVTTDFLECLEEQCPYWGRTVLEHRSQGGFRTVKDPVCRRAADND